MERFYAFLPCLIAPMSLVLAIVPLYIGIAQAEEMGGRMSCPMCGVMGWGGMFLAALFILALIAALVSLSIFLWRRSKGNHHA